MWPAWEQRLWGVYCCGAILLPPGDSVSCSPDVFFPQPEVDSAVVRLAKRQEPEVAVDDEDLFFTLVRGAFGQRRKTLANALAGARIFPGWTRATWEEVLKRAGIDPRCRGETLGLKEFAALARACRQRLREC